MDFFNEILGLFIVPVAFIVLTLVKLLFKKISVYLCMAPIATYAIHYIFEQLFAYSPLSYLGLILSLLGVFMLFYNFKRNMAYTFIQFWKRLLILYAKVALLIWFLISVYQVIHYIIV
ncbi:hypothetical protein KG089_00160 [Carnobacteriaceae bacterium zg-ZUI252]|nr:hypothetical protein [Carnobacteriaceae bacterium zg-ZUI252]MBS4770546.1 hypothetical protein [Carnobacteriaceae bacterium zg-ZUI240]QTU82591.1 hypothetical protein J7S27_04590 [Carnobacteriaceae bacterium zg-C25]